MIQRVWRWFLPFGDVIDVIIAIVKKIIGKNICVLGPVGAGKTTFFNMLRGICTKPSPTNIDPIEKFEIDTEFFDGEFSGRKVKIKKCQDIGGNRNDLYEIVMKDAEIIFFIFDVLNYLKEKEYQKNVNAFLEFIYVYATCKIIDIQNNVVIICNYFANKRSDMTKESAGRQFVEILKEKPYRKMIQTNCFVADITNKEDVKKIIRKIF